jgi:flagellar biosynthesis/type III secretory pathway M-ring protein FliF/YscJ
MRMLALVILARFLFTLVSLTVGWVDVWVLETRQQTAMQELTQAREDIEALRTETPETAPTESSIRQRFDALIDEGRQLMDMEAQLESLSNRAESAIGQLLELTVLFLVQTLLVPIGAFWLALGAFRWFWGWARRA